MTTINYCAACGTPIRKEGEVWVHYRHSDHVPVVKAERVDYPAWSTNAPTARSSDAGKYQPKSAYTPVNKALIPSDSYYIDKGDGSSFAISAGLFWALFLAFGFVGWILIAAGSWWGLVAWAVFVGMELFFHYRA